MYNVAQYVERCIISLEDQDIPENSYEIVCVNDGSPDNSAEMVRSLQKTYTNILLINQENKGVSQARNRGIEEATGDYLLFVDPDDAIHSRSLGTILKEIIRKDAQMAIPGYTYLDANDKLHILKEFQAYEDKIYSGVDSYNITVFNGHKMSGLAVGIIFRRDFIVMNYLRFTPDVVLNQDVEFLARAYCMSERVIFLRHELYTSVERKGSATRSNQFKTERVRQGFLKAAKNLVEFRKNNKLENQQLQLINSAIIQFVFLVLSSAINSKSVNTVVDTIKLLKAKGFSKLDIDGCKGERLLFGKFYNFSPILGTVIMYLILSFVKQSR